MSVHESHGGQARSFNKHPWRTGPPAGEHGDAGPVTFAVDDAVTFLQGHGPISVGSRARVTACYISSRIVQVRCAPADCGRPDGLTLDVPTDKLALDEAASSTSGSGLLRTTRPAA